MWVPTIIIRLASCFRMPNRGRRCDGGLLKSFFGKHAKVSNAAIALVFAVQEHLPLREVTFSALLLLRDTATVFGLLVLQPVHVLSLTLKLNASLFDVPVHF